MVIDNRGCVLASDIRFASAKLIEIVRKVPADHFHIRSLEGTGGLCSVADLLAYQIGWGKRLISWYQAGITKQPLLMPGEGFSTWDYEGLARHFYKKYSYEGVITAVKEFTEVVNQILAFVECEQLTGNIYKTGVWDWCTLRSGKQWPLEKWVRVNTVAPYKRATATIRKAMREGKL